MRDDDRDDDEPMESDRPDARTGRRGSSPGGWMYGGLGYGSRMSDDHRGRGPKGYRRSDARIHEDVCEALAEDPRLDASEVEVRVVGGEVTLAGYVPDRQSKRIAEDAAYRAPGVLDVINTVRVKRVGPSREHSQAIAGHTGSTDRDIPGREGGDRGNGANAGGR